MSLLAETKRRVIPYLGKHKLERSSTPDAIAEHEKKNKQELELCKAAGLVVAVGSWLQRKYSKSLRDIDV